MMNHLKVEISCLTEQSYIKQIDKI